MIRGVNAIPDDKPPGQPLWGIDLGGTKIEGAVLAPSEPSRALRLRRPTNAHLGYDHILLQIAGVIGDLELCTGTPRPHIIGIGTPGTTVPATGCVKNSNTLCLNGRMLVSDLASLLGCSVLAANDANCFALAEATLGSAKGAGTVFGIILGTGVGGGIVTGGKVLEGKHGICGEWGHNTLSGETTPCYCGRIGCLETVCSGPALQDWYRDRTGITRSLPEIVVAADSGEEAAVATLGRLREKFSEALAAVINLLDPDAIVIGGGVGNIPLLRDERTSNLVAKHLFNDRFDTPLLAPSLGDSAGVLGAAMLTAGKNGSRP
jgi:N-acetylglucosamine kinase